MQAPFASTNNTNPTIAGDLNSLLFALDTIGIGLWELNLKTNTVIWDDRCKALFGLTKGSTILYEEAIHHIHPEDAARVKAAVASAISGADGGRYEERYRTIGADDGQLRWVHYKGQLYTDDAGQPDRLAGTAQDITAHMAITQEVAVQEQIRKEAEESELYTRSILQSSPVAAIVFTGERMVMSVVNEEMLELLGRDASIIGQPFMEALPELMHTPLMDRLHHVFNSGETFYNSEERFELMRYGQSYTGYYNYTYKALYNTAGEIYGIINTAVEVTELVTARQRAEKSEARFRSLIQAAPVAIGLFIGRELRIEEPNQTFIDIVGKGWDIVGKPLAEAMPELVGQPYLQILDDVYTSGKIFQTFGTQVNIVQDGVMKYGFYDFSYTPLFDTRGKVYGILDIAVDVTEQVMARKRMEESHLQLLASFEQSPVGITIISEDRLTFRMANTFYGQLAGRSPDQLVGKPLLEALPELKGQGFDRLLEQVIATGVPYTANEVATNVIRNNHLETIYVDLTYQPYRENDNKITGVLVVATDVTKQVLARQKIEAAEEALRGAIELAELGTWSIDLTTRLLTYSDRLNAWFGWEDQGLITVEKAYSAIAEQDHPLIRASIAHAITPGTDGIYDVEYTAIDQKTGRERILHAQGKAIFNEQGVAYKINGTAQDVTEQRHIQLALEQQVQERTEELAVANEELHATNEELGNANDQLVHSNEELAQYAYVASHDLQEPLRKIRMFSGILRGQDDLSEKNALLVAKINQSSERMTMLIQDLLEFSRLLNTEALLKTVNLGEICRLVVTDFELAIAEKGAIVHIGDLPSIYAVQLHMNQLFHNLLNNALKFSRASASPVITVDAQLISLQEARAYFTNPDRLSDYYHLTFTDNGIGFEQQYAEQIFEVFKRLHGRDEYPGSGIGLALCRRIVANQQGHIFATSVPGEGTTFHIILPDRQNHAH